MSKKVDFQNYTKFLHKEIKKNGSIERLGSLRDLAKKYGVAHVTLAEWTKKILVEKYGNKIGLKLYKDYIKKRISRNPNYNILIKNFKRHLKRQFNEFYPEKYYEIDSLNSLANKFGIRRETATNWARLFLLDIYDEKKAEDLYYEIWSERCIRQNPDKIIQYVDAFSYVIGRGGKMITTEIEFDNSAEYPSKRMINVTCENNHHFLIETGSMLYRDRWCPQCQSHKTEQILRLFMEKIFRVKFPETSLFRAFKISANRGGKLRIDGYCANVYVNGKNCIIAFEYDGAQHDLYPNSYHSSMRDFLIQQRRDNLKRNILKDRGVVLINLKKCCGFDIDTIYKFQKEIIRQFQQFTAKNLSISADYIYDPIKNILKEK